MELVHDKRRDTVRKVARITLPAVLALSSPLFVVDYLTDPARWHEFFGLPWFGSAMSGVAFMSGLIGAAMCWHVLAPQVVHRETVREYVTRLLHQGDVLEVRAVRR